jgi:hypothetical protein
MASQLLQLQVSSLLTEICCFVVNFDIVNRNVLCFHSMFITVKVYLPKLYLLKYLI